MSVQEAKIIYDQLKEFGLTRAQVRKLLPTWWMPQAEKHADGVAELCALIGRRLSLDVSALMNGQVRCKAGAPLAYKHRVDATPQSLQGATSIALSLAAAVSEAIKTPYTPIPTSPEIFGAQVRKDGDGLVGLRSLISTCWAMGVPVVPMPNLPVGLRKMDGAVINVNNRPVILISKKKSSQAWLAFIVAHEIGHIGRRHLDQNGSIIDVSLQEQATYETDGEGDQQEREADEYALGLLGGPALEEVISKWSIRASPAEIAVNARMSHKSLGVEAGHLVLRYAFKTKRWPDAVSALKYLKEDADAEAVMREALLRNLDFNLIADDLRDFVFQVTGIEESIVD
jgi:hypothetical protein